MEFHKPASLEIKQCCFIFHLGTQTSKLVILVGMQVSRQEGRKQGVRLKIDRQINNSSIWLGLLWFNMKRVFFTCIGMKPTVRLCGYCDFPKTCHHDP